MESTIATEAGPGVTQVRSLDASVQGFDHTYASEEPHSEESQSLKENITPTKNSINRWHLSKALWNVWWLEVSSSLLGLGCLLAIVIILSVHDERPLPNWPDLISINSLIAIFTAVFKAALILPIAEGIGQLKWTWYRQPQRLDDIVLFDNATRGPWGCLLLIIKQLPRPRKAYLAGLGAFITIAALAVDPISKAMIEHRACALSRQPTAAEGAEIPRTNTYMASRGVVTNPRATLDYAMEVALTNGLTKQEEAAALIKFNCSTGNCTFKEENKDYFFSSLAMCYSCQNITDEILAPKTNSKGTTGTRKWTLPSGPQVSEGISRAMLSAATNSYRLFDDDDEPFFSFDTLMLTNPHCEGPDNECMFNSRYTEAIASRCRLDLCVKRYYGEVRNGIYIEEEDSSTMRLSRNALVQVTSAMPQIAWVLVTNTSLVDGQEIQCSATMKESDMKSPMQPDWKLVLKGMCVGDGNDGVGGDPTSTRGLTHRKRQHH
ncbi:hypothetical protein CKAH01_05935 [Colletotrichum kahawae]|uniref:Uncharacterized protein n=1 Tax=Colletotrichum kahawae TaxID=34407 RepID=A0AAD9Y9L7_COLKA|nr:hypothetical protein CKAH01_05935 [Colletotrichum kahawae]